jgi:L-malate glycosyltransferase
MKIGITCYPTYGGSGAVATELGIALAARGHAVHFITYAPPFRLPEFLPRVFFHQVDVGRYPLFEYPPYDLALAVRMHEVVRNYNLDVLHCHYAIPHATSAWIAREMMREAGNDVAVVTTLHGTDITIVGQDPSYWSITKFSIEKSDRITAVSKQLQQQTIDAFGCTNCSVDVIYNFINPETYDRRRYPGALKTALPAEGKVLMHVSNFRSVKRTVDVVRVFAKVNEKVPSVLMMVGDGPDRGRTEEEARALGVADRVVFMGRIENVAPMLAGADLFLLPSKEESFGLSALEAMASGVPVVASTTGGIPELVTHGETGYLSPVGDVEGMARDAVRILTDPAEWGRLSTNAAADARARFNEDTIISQYERVYGEAIAALAARRR